MNFSKFNRPGKVLSLSLALILVCAAFAGCNRTTSPDADTTSGLNLNLSEPSDTTTSSTTEPTQTETVATGDKMGTVTSQMNVRKSPSMDAAVDGTLYAGDRVYVSYQETIVGHTWGYITSPMDGWIVMDYVQMDNASDETPTVTTPAASGSDTDTNDTDSSTSGGATTTTTSTQGVVTGNGVNIRSEPSTDGKIQGSYNKGDVITILETSNGWGRTSRGWVNMNYVDTSGTSNTTNTTTNNTNNSNTTSNVTGNGSTTVQLRGIVNTAELNIRSSASTEGDRLGSYTYGDRVEILEKSGNWGRTSKGWISLSYVYQDGTTGSKTATGTVTASGGLNIRSGPGTGYGSVGSYAEGDTVNILEQFTYDGVTWGCTSKGWISMRYVDTGDTDTSTDSGSDEESLHGTVIAEGGLRIRSGAGSSYAVVGSLDYGDEVTVTSRTIADDTTWGKISQGWICLDYVDLS